MNIEKKNQERGEYLEKCSVVKMIDFPDLFDSGIRIGKREATRNTPNSRIIGGQFFLGFYFPNSN